MLRSFFGGALGAALVVALFTIVAPVGATFPDSWQLATQQGCNTQGTAVNASDCLTNLGVSDGTNWVRATSSTFSGFGTSNNNIAQEALSTTSEAIPTTAMTSRTELCVFNQDTAINVFCKDTVAATSANGVMIEPRTGRCVKATEVINCIAASGTPTIDYEER